MEYHLEIGVEFWSILQRKIAQRLLNVWQQQQRRGRRRQIERNDCLFSKALIEIE